MNLTVEEIIRMTEVTKRNLRQFEFFDEKNHHVRVFNMPDFVSVDYRTSSGIPIGTTHFDLNISDNSKGKICYLAEIELLESLRGKGYGRKLYKIIEDIGRGLGCDRIFMYPSGWTPNGKRRRDYMIRLGYEDLNGTDVQKKL
jgi:GNAT superfamily N-acetyltransferase